MPERSPEFLNLVTVAEALIPNVEDCLRHLSKDHYSTYSAVWDATRNSLTDLQQALAAVTP